MITITIGQTKPEIIKSRNDFYSGDSDSMKINPLNEAEPPKNKKQLILIYFGELSNELNKEQCFFFFLILVQAHNLMR